jgi:radical SAM superfamily enzyme YgiQ (UPF0313 family)
MQVMGGFIVGFDSDTENVFESQIRFIQQIGVVTAMVGVLGAIPHTRLWHRLKAEGRLLSDTTGDNTDGSLNFVPRMGTERLLRGYQRVVDTIYSPKYYYERIYTFVRNYRPTAKSKISKEEVVALLKSIWWIGIFSRNNLRYWKLLIKIACTRIKALPIAIELAIYGQHFQRMAERVQKEIPQTLRQLTKDKRQTDAC